MIWYEQDVKQIEQVKNQLDYPPKTIFYGSSSIRLWDRLYDDFAAYQPVNLGFGGSTLEACVAFFERVLMPYQQYNPEHLVIYAGDNDLGDGKTPEFVFAALKQLVGKVHQYFPGMLFTYISIKPSIARQHILGNIRKANSLIQQFIHESGHGHYYVDVYNKMIDAAGNPKPELFDADGLHLSGKGYEVWKEALLTHISLNVEASLTR